jgi:dihydroxy-acid dehydratase
MFTANSMNCLCEALGIALPGNGTIPAVYAERIRLAKRAGETVMAALKSNLRPSDILTAQSVRNALTVDMALGCSTNSVLHLFAVAHECGLKVSLDMVNEISEHTPNLCRLAPAGAPHMQDHYPAGGVYAVMHELLEAGLLDGTVLTAEGKTMKEALRGHTVRDRAVIRSVAEPYAASGGLAVLFGNLAPRGGVVKRSAVKEAMLRFTGTAKTFDKEEDAVAAIYAGKIHSGDVVVIRYEGPAGGPACGKCCPPPRPSSAWVSTNPWHSSRTGAFPAPRAAPPSGTSRPRRVPAARSL